MSGGNSSSNSSEASSSSSSSSAIGDDDDHHEIQKDNQHYRRKSSASKKKVKKHPNKKRKRMRRKKIVTVEEWAMLILPNLKEKISSLKKLHTEQAEKDSIFQVGGSGGNNNHGNSSMKSTSNNNGDLLSPSANIGARKPTMVNFAPIHHLHHDNDDGKVNHKQGKNNSNHLPQHQNPTKAVSFRV